MVEAGGDGEISLIYSYAETHPELVRVKEPVMDFTFSVFTARSGFKAPQLTDLPADALVEYPYSYKKTCGSRIWFGNDTQTKEGPEFVCRLFQTGTA